MLSERYTLWIDGVGAYLLCLGEQITIGGSNSDSAELALLGPLNRRHATILRNGEGYLVEAHAETKIEGRPVTERALLGDGQGLELGQGVRLRFRRPSPLSATARLEFESDHRPANRIDGVILMEENCLLGPTADCHVHCPAWRNAAVLYRRNGNFRIKATSEVWADERMLDDAEPFPLGGVISGSEFRFRVERTE